MSGGGGEGAAGDPVSLLVTTTAEPTTTEAPTTTVAPTTTEVPTTTVAPPPTEAPTTVAPPPTEPPTTTLPPNIVPVLPVDPPLGAVGSRSGGETARVQARLFELGFWLSGADGSYGLTTKQAVMAFQKYMGFDASGSVDQRTADGLTSMTLRPIARANSGTLVEIDKAKQLLFMVIDGRTDWILNTSTGNGEEYTEEDKNSPGEMITGVSLTPSGLHKVNRERPGRLVGGRPRRDLPAEVLRRRRRRARLEQHPQLSRLTRLRPSERPGDGLDLGQRRDADGRARLGPRRRLSVRIIRKMVQMSRSARRSHHISGQGGEC